MTSFYHKAGKRIFDVVLAVAALVLSAPVILLLSVLVYLKLGSPILFRQQRPGLHGKPFTLYKFRTMRDAVDREGNPLPDAQRLTPFGRLLRTSSLDELPELINVLKGEMSLVGPRPLLMEYLLRYTPRQAHRHDMKPGITGWAQINGRQDIKFSERIEYDLWYIDHVTFLRDVDILVQTFRLAVQGSGVRNGQDVQEVDDLRPIAKAEGKGSPE